MPGNTKTFSVTDAAYVAITAAIDTHMITVQEDNSVAGWPTTAYTIKKPTTAATAIQKAAGARTVFQKSAKVSIGDFPFAFKAGEVVGYIQTVSGTTTFAQDDAGL